MSVEQKYTVPEVHHDLFNIDLGDGKPDGPGPAHYKTESEAFVGAADWIWIYAEANTRKKGRRGHDYEWDSFLFVDRSNGAYGFTTPEVHCQAEVALAPWRAETAVLAHLGRQTVQVTGYIHSHPRFLMGTAPQVFSGVETDQVTGEVSGDRVAAYDFRNRRWWLGLLTPKGSVQRIRLTPSATDPVNRLGSADPPLESVLDVLRSSKPGVWEFIEDRKQKGQNWQPGTKTWREKAIAAASRELGKLPQGRTLKEISRKGCEDSSPGS